MNINLKNIGVIKNSNIQLDGLTVITGDNSSGKTTVGKAIYSLIDAVSDIGTKVRRDKCHYIENVLKNVRSTFNFFSIFWDSYDRNNKQHFFDRNGRDIEKKSKLFENKPNILEKEQNIYDLIVNFSQIRRLIDSYQYELIVDYVTKLKKELENFDTVSFFDDNPIFTNLKRYGNRNHILDEDYQKIIYHEIQEAIMLLSKMFYELDSDPGDINYTRSSINETLRIEFSKQIQPVKYNDVDSKIIVSDDERNYFSIEIASNKIIKSDKTVYMSGIDLKKAFFIDNPFVLDNPLFRRNKYSHDDEFDSILNTEEILPHEAKLNKILKSNDPSSVFEKMINENISSDIKEKINLVLSGEFEFTDDGDFYVKDGKQLNVTNLATGSKMFAIIKLLIDKGEIDDTTLLVLDEPESHLHPNWQNKFAEIIVLIVKELGTRVLLTSHSPNFVLAIDAYMRKYGIQDKTNFYQTNSIDGYFVEYKNVNDDIGLIYDDFAKDLAEMKALRDFYYYKGLGE